MTIEEIAKRWTVGLLAEILGVSCQIVESILPFEPRWLGYIAALEARLRAAAWPEDAEEAGDGEDTEAAEAAEALAGTESGSTGPSSRGGDEKARSEVEALVEANAILREGLNELRARGLAIDEVLLRRMSEEWDSASVVGYMQAADGHIKEMAADFLERAAVPLAKPSMAQAARDTKVRRLRAVSRTPDTRVSGRKGGDEGEHRPRAGM